MSVVIKAVGVRHGKSQKGNDVTKWQANNQWYNVMGNHDLEGKTVSLNPTKIKNLYDLEFIVDEQPPLPETNGTGKIVWSEYISLVRGAHELATELEPDVPGEGGTSIDRSQARRGIINTILMQYGNGAFEFPEVPF